MDVGVSFGVEVDIEVDVEVDVDVDVYVDVDVDVEPHIEPQALQGPDSNGRVHLSTCEINSLRRIIYILSSKAPISYDFTFHFHFSSFFFG